MIFSRSFARLVALIGGAALLWRRTQGIPHQAAWGATPAIPVGKPQGSIPTLKMPTARGWADGQLPTPARGLKVNAFATKLNHPRWMYVLPNGDLLVAEATQVVKPPTSLFGYAVQATMRRANALGVSADRITLLRDGDRDGIAEVRSTFMEGLNQPFGMALVSRTFYIGNTDGIVAFPYSDGADRIPGSGTKLVTFQAGGHWTRSLLPSPDGKKLYAGVGSMTNIADMGLGVEKGRAAIYELDLASGTSRIFASGLRNPVGMAWEPGTGVLWTVVNERDGLGDETPPDYLTSVRDGTFYGWPFCYWGQIVDDRVPQDPAMVAKAITPDYALGGAHRFAWPVLAAGGYVTGISGGHGDRPAWFVESQYPQWLQGRVCAIQKWAAVRPAERHSLGIPRSRRAGVLRSAGGRHAWTR